MEVRSLVRPGAYYDSLVLMQLQQALSLLPGVVEVGVVMGTEANRGILERSGLVTEDLEAVRPDDLVVAIRGQSADAAVAALARLDEFLCRTGSTGEREYVPKSLEMASRMLPSADWVLLSVPGLYASGVARQALCLGKHVFLFSDHVALHEEAELKREAERRGLLLLGPECGTAIVGGVGFGFANRVKKGPVGLVSASGTGLQQVSCLVSRRSGVSHALGTGGRDLADEVGGVASVQGLDLLRRDPETRVIVLISKPPSVSVARRLLEEARRAGKPVVVLFLGYAAPARRAGNLHFASTLEDAAGLAIELAAHEEPSLAEIADSRANPSGNGDLCFARGQRYLRGLYSGGTLAYEAQLLLWSHGLAVSTNDLASSDFRGSSAGRDAGPGHRVLDLGTEEFTQGRPHPMISNDVRIRVLRQEARDPEVAVILLDVVLGDGAHPDPARELASACSQAVAEARKSGRRLEVIAVVVGTEDDPQGLESQVKLLEAAGIRVFMGNEAAVGHAASLARALEECRPLGPPVPVPLTALEPPAAALNVGLEWFAGSLQAQGVPTLHVDWRPPAGGGDRLQGILRRMKGHGA